MMTVRGYTVVSRISEGEDLMLCRAIRILDGLPVLLKLTTLPDPSPLTLGRLEHEYEIARDLDPDRIARPLALERYGGKAALVFEQGPTKTLASLLACPMEILPFLHIAIGINAALAELHHHQLVHKDLKPEHVLLDEANHVWLTGLGIASRLPREPQPPQPPDHIAGSLAYMAPEQTGRMNRSIDFRSDLYALGINFYQMLTGVLPFAAADPMEWVHCHIARQPLPPCQRVPGLPDPLSEMVMKLLAKTAEERYQSSAGLDADLRRCLEAWESKGRIAPFPLGAHDTPEQLLVPEKLYGRESQIETLQAAFQRVLVTGNPELVLVSGYSGIGKTSVVRELHKTLVPPRGLFAAGKFHQYERDIPYATLVRALQSLVRHILGKSKAEVEGWRSLLQEAVSPNGQLIVDLIPEVELIIGNQPPVAELPPQEARNRFQAVLLQFIGVFARPEHPLALFLDDLQWSDGATLDLLTHLTTQSRVRGLLLVGAYRDNEVTATHPLMRAMETIRKGETSVQDILLAPLTVHDVCCLVADSLLCKQEYALPLAELVHQKTGGNPFFVIQFLTALAEERLLTFDLETGRWTWDLGQIQTKGFTDNVADLVVDQLGRLPERTREALEQLACLGNVSDAPTLARVHGTDEDSIHELLWQALLAGFVSKQNNSFKFLHDRIQQSAYSLVPETERPARHLHIGRLLLAHTPEEELKEKVFEIVGHLNRGTALITDQDETLRLAELNFIAGRRAKLSSAYSSAIHYFTAGIDLLSPNLWESSHNLAYNLHLELAECQYLEGDFENSDLLLTAALEQSRSLIDRGRVYIQRQRYYQLTGQWPESLQVGLQALELFGVVFPDSDEDIQEATQEENALIQVNLQGRPIASIAGVPFTGDAETQSLIDLIAESMVPCFVVRPLLWFLMTARAVNLCLKHGHTDKSPFLYSCYSMILVGVHQEFSKAFEFSQMALELNERISEGTAWSGRPPFIHGSTIGIWKQPFGMCLPLLQQAFQTMLNTGDLVYASYLSYNAISLHMENSDPLEQVVEIAGRYARFNQQNHNDIVAWVNRAQQQFAMSLQGKTRSLTDFSDDSFDEKTCVSELEQAGFDLGTAYYFIMKQVAAYHAGHFHEALEWARKAEANIAPVSSMAIAVSHFFYYALTLTALHEQMPNKRQQKATETLTTIQETLRSWADNCPDNFAGHYALVSAEIARIHGRNQDAMELYEEAINSTRQTGLVRNQAVAYETAASFHRQRGHARLSGAYATEALTCYQRWGAHGIVQQMKKEHSWLSQAEPPETETLQERLEMLSLAKAQQAISGEINLSNLAQKLLRIVIESAGAQSGVLSVEGSAPIRAESEPDDTGRQQIVADLFPPSEKIPTGMMNYVKNSRNTVILDDATAAGDEFLADEYIQRHEPKSVLCMPIQRQEKLLGTLYLENNLLTGAFTSEHRFQLEVLASQAAISLETAATHEALRESEERYRSLIRKVQTAIVLYDDRGKILDSNPLARELLGISKDQHRGTSLTDPEWYFLREDGSIMPAAEYPVSMVLSSQRALKGYVAGICRPDRENTSWVLVNAEPEYGNNGEIQLVIVSFVEITERKQAEERNTWNLAVNEALSSLYAPIVTAGTTIEEIAIEVLEKSRQLTSSTHGYVGEIDPTTGDLIAHTHTKMLLSECKITKADLRQTRFPRGTDGLYPALWGHALNTKKAFFTDSPAEHPVSLGIPEGHIPIERFLTVPVSLAGELVGQIALSNSTRAYTSRDLDAIHRFAEFFALAIQHKRAEMKIRILNQELEQRVADRTAKLEAVNKELEAFAYSVSHDLRAPLRHIGGFLELLQNRTGTTLDAKSRHHMNSIFSAVTRMGQLIDDLLSFSRMGRDAMSLRSVDLEALVQVVLAELEPDAAGRTIAWRIGNLPTVSCDSAMLRVVMANLIANAMKFTRPRNKARIEIGSLPGRDTETVIYVRDNGVGFNMAYADKLFGVFQRLHGADEFEGTGIGLANVHRIIARHGGRTWADSSLDQGATFYFSLPRSLQGA